MTLKKIIAAGAIALLCVAFLVWQLSDAEHTDDPAQPHEEAAAAAGPELKTTTREAEPSPTAEAGAKGVLRTVDGMASIEEIAGQIAATLEAA